MVQFECPRQAAGPQTPVSHSGWENSIFLSLVGNTNWAPQYKDVEVFIRGYGAQLIALAGVA